MSLDPARRDLAILALLRAKRRANLVRAVIGRRLAFDTRARLLGTVLSIVEPILEAIENLIPDRTP